MPSPMHLSADHQLARGISEIDLKEALEEVAIQAATGLRYTTADLFNIRDEQVRGLRSQTGLITPPFRALPNAPPPTPATPSGTGTPLSNYLRALGISSSGTSTPESEAPHALNEIKEEVKEDGKVDDVLQQLPNGTQPKTKTKSKKKKKPAGSNALKGGVRGSGFEEFFADPPLDPEEYMEECDLYDISVPFESRMQTCIQRYRGRRKLDETRSNILTKYFMLGGIETSAKQFTGGLDQETVEKSTAAEIAAIQASDYIRTDAPGDKYYDGSDKWVIDFEGVAKGFFSYRIPHMFPIDNQKQIEVYTMTVRNFLNYVLHHQVCEDYKDDVFAARKICDLAEKELWEIKQLRDKLPGDFNVAASTVHGGVYQGIHMGDASWAAEDPNYKEYLASDRGFSTREAERIFKTAIAFAGDDELFKVAMATDATIVDSTSYFYEVVGVERVDVKTAEEYAMVRDAEGSIGHIKALGKLLVKHWDGPQEVPQDLADGESPYTDDEDNVYAFWLEDEILQYCFVGLKMDIEVKTLSIGVEFFDRVNGLYSSFFTYLPNEKMQGWKDPVPNTRSAPTEDDPEVEEAIMDDLAREELDEVDGLLKDDA